jgi:hypothetical protein
VIAAKKGIAKQLGDRKLNIPPLAQNATKSI